MSVGFSDMLQDSSMIVWMPQFDYSSTWPWISPKTANRDNDMVCRNIRWRSVLDIWPLIYETDLLKACTRWHDNWYIQLFHCSVYTLCPEKVTHYARCFIKRTPFSFFHNSLKWWTIYTNFLPVVAEKILIQNISTECGSWLNILC